MRERVVIKWGGGLITDKTTLCTPNLPVIAQLAEAVKRCIDSGVDVVLVHGAGSFGHLRAKHWRLNEGRVDATFASMSSALLRMKPFNTCVKTCWHSTLMCDLH
jgi:isopentenyl phosphate kinase